MNTYSLAAKARVLRSGAENILSLAPVAPDVLLQIGDDRKLSFVRLSTGNCVETADAIRENIIVPAMHGEAVAEALGKYLRQPLALA